MKDALAAEFEAAYVTAYPDREPPEVRAINGAYLIAGQTMSPAEVRMAAAKLKANAGKPLFTRASESSEERVRLIDAIRSGNRGNLTVGEILHERISRGRSIENLEAWLRTQGLQLPSKGTRSKYIQAYEAWIKNAGLEMGKEYHHPSYTDDAGNMIAMTLDGISTYALYELRNSVTKSLAVKYLALAYTNNVEDLKDLAKEDNERLEPSEPMRTLKVPKSILDRMKDIGQRMPGKTNTDVFAFMVEFMHDFVERDPELFESTVLAYWGDDVPQAREET